MGEAPGRLDVIGGVADYSGALVLETPTAATTTVTATEADRFVVGPVSLDPGELALLARSPFETARELLAPAPRWTHYLVGVALVLVRHGVVEPPVVELSVSSRLPQAVGVASSAALEVATARALGADDLEPVRLAALCQEAENRVVGAPCGIMDQVAVVSGVPGHVLPVLCRPATVHAPEPLPPGVEVVGWPTGAVHDVGGPPYARARSAAFMGKAMIEQAAGRRWRWVSELPPAAVAGLPVAVEGERFLERWGETGDDATTVDPAVVYPVRAATAFGGEEHRRAQRALAALVRGELAALGPLMAASHAGYDAIGLGHPAATERVEQALARPGVYGARSSGGGCGGTVVVVCARGALDDVDDLIR